MDANLQNFVDKMNQGPVQFMLDPDGDDTGPHEIFVNEGLDLTFMRPHAESPVDILGVYDMYTEGDSAEFEVTVPEMSLNVLNIIFPEGVLAGDNSYRGFGRAAGHSMRQHALKSRFRPYSSKSSDTDQLILWKVIPTGDVTLTRTKSDPHAYAVTFRALPDPTQVDGELIGRIYASQRS
jgi:hypothetical protein